MTVKGGTTPACAACKYQRRKCSPSCPLAPYFPANQPKMFQNVHRLFGVSNVTKILKSLNTKLERDDAMQSIIFESNARERHPVEGCTAVIKQLHLQYEYALHERRNVYMKLAACRDHLNKQQAAGSTSNWVSGPTHLEFGSDPTIHQMDSSNMLFGPTQFEFGSASGNGAVLPMLANQYLLNENSDFYPDSMSNISNLPASIQDIRQQMESFGIHQFPNPRDFEESVMNLTDEKLSQIKTKEAFEQIETKVAFESSSDATRPSVDHRCRRDLKNAAAASVSLLSIRMA